MLESSLRTYVGLGRGFREPVTFCLLPLRSSDPQIYGHSDEIAGREPTPHIGDACMAFPSPAEHRILGCDIDLTLDLNVDHEQKLPIHHYHFGAQWS